MTGAPISSTDITTAEGVSDFTSFLQLSALTLLSLNAAESSLLDRTKGFSKNRHDSATMSITLCLRWAITIKNSNLVFLVNF